MSEDAAPAEGHGSAAVVSKAKADASEASWFTEDVGFDVPSRGDIREGTIVSVSRGEILVDIGAKSEGVIDSREAERMLDRDRAKLVEGEQVLVYVVNPEDRNGNIVLSLTKAEEEMDWRWAEELLDTQDIFEGEIESHNGRFNYRIGSGSFPMPIISKLPKDVLDLGVRPEHIQLGDEGVPATVHLVQPIGPFTYVTVTWEGGSATARVSGVSSLRPRENVRVSFDTTGMLFFDRETSLMVELD